MGCFCRNLHLTTKKNEPIYKIIKYKLFNHLPPKSLIWIFTHLKLCLADAIHNFKWVKSVQIWQMEVNDFEILLIDVTFCFCMFKR